MWEGYVVHKFIHSEKDHMPSRHRLQKDLPYEIDIKGIAVALAFLLSVGVFAVGRDDRPVSEDRQASSASMQIAQPITIEKTVEKTDTLQHPDNEADRSDTSLTFTASR